MKLPERTTGKPGCPPFYVKKKEACQPGWQKEWDRVLELRNENDLTMGGQCSVEWSAELREYVYRSSWCKRHNQGKHGNK